MTGVNRDARPTRLLGKERLLRKERPKYRRQSRDVDVAKRVNYQPSSHFNTGSYLPSSSLGSKKCFGSEVRKYVTRVAVEMHNGFEKQDSIHRVALNSRFSLDTSRVSKSLCIFVVGVASDFRGRKLGVKSPNVCQPHLTTTHKGK